MLIDDFLPEYHVSKHHRIRVDATPEVVFHAVLNLDLSVSGPVRILFRLRGMPVDALTLEGMLHLGFARLGADPPREIVLGLIGRFWSLSGDIQRTDSNHFRAFATPGYAKAAWNFCLTPQADGATVLITETRVLCLDEKSRRRFRWYWAAVSPFSGWIRKEALRIIKADAERHR